MEEEEGGPDQVRAEPEQQEVVSNPPEPVVAEQHEVPELPELL